MIKIMVIDSVGMVIGDVVVEPQKPTTVKMPLFLAPSSQGNITLQSNPLFETAIEVNERYIVATSLPKATMLEQYEAYVTQKRTGLVSASPSPSGKIIL